MRGSFKSAADALAGRLKLVLSEDALKLAGEPVRVPTVSVGIPANRPKYLVWIDPLPRQNSTTGSATAHESRNDFTLSAFFIATHSDRDTAIACVQRWLECAYGGILADATLDRAVDSAIPRIGDSGYDATPDKRVIVAAELEVRCSFFSTCPAELKEYVRAHRDM